MNKKMLGICLAAAVISTGTLGVVVASEVGNQSFMPVSAEVDQSGKTYGKYRLWIGSNSAGDYFYDPAIGNLSIGIDIYQAGVAAAAIESYVFAPEDYFKAVNSPESATAFYYAVDIDAKYCSSAYDIEIKRMEGMTTHTWSGKFNFDRLNEIIYLWNTNNSGDQWNYMKGHSFGSLSVASKDIAAKAIEGLYTCSSSPINGYGAFDRVGGTFLWDTNKQSKIDGSLSGYEILDFSNNAAWQDSATERSTPTDVVTKYNALRALSGVLDAPNLG